MASKTIKQQITDDIVAAGEIIVVRNTMASGTVLEARKKPYKVPGDVTVEDAFELVAVVRKAILPKMAKKKEEKKKEEEKK